MALVRVTHRLVINPAQVASLTWERNDYSPSRLIITMTDGTRHSVRHQPHLLDGVDAYDVERRLIAATEAVN